MRTSGTSNQLAAQTIGGFKSFSTFNISPVPEKLSVKPAAIAANGA